MGLARQDRRRCLGRALTYLDRIYIPVTMPGSCIRLPVPFCPKGLPEFARELKGFEADDVDALHRARVASRRLRELLPLLELNRDVARHLGRRLRKTTKQLGTVRERDVLIILIRELSEESRYPSAALKHWARRPRKRALPRGNMSRKAGDCETQAAGP